METLYDRLKPELLSNLMQNRKKHDFPVDQCITLLESNYHYGDLSINDANKLSTFTGADWVNATSIELRHGSYMFNDPKPTTNE